MTSEKLLFEVPTRARIAHHPSQVILLALTALPFKSNIIDSPVCTMAVCLDTEGNSLLLHQLKAK